MRWATLSKQLTVFVTATFLPFSRRPRPVLIATANIFLTAIHWRSMYIFLEYWRIVFITTTSDHMTTQYFVHNGHPIFCLLLSLLNDMKLYFPRIVLGAGNPKFILLWRFLLISIVCTKVSLLASSKSYHKNSLGVDLMLIINNKYIQNSWFKFLRF